MFRNLWCICTDKRGGGQFFAILCGSLLWTALSNLFYMSLFKCLFWQPVCMKNGNTFKTGCATAGRSQKNWLRHRIRIPKTKTPNPVSLQILDSESVSVPISAKLLHTLYTHHTIHTKSGSAFEKCSRTPDSL